MTIPANFSFSQKCSKHFTYMDFLNCSDTFKANDCINFPQQMATLRSMERLASEILDNVFDEFGQLRLTYGFCSENLRKLIKKNIYPPLDQHAGHEIKKNGKHICERLGFAADFNVPNVSSLLVARFIVSNLTFDRLYYYGNTKPIHVSLNEQPINSVVLMAEHANRRVPKNITKERFLTDKIDF